MNTCVLKVSPQFDVHNQTPAEQWSKKPRATNRIKAADIFKANPKKERKALGAIHNLKFHGEKTRICSHRKLVDKHLSRSKGGDHMSVPEAVHLKKQPFTREQGTLQSFSSELVQGSSQNAMDDEMLVSFKPALHSTPCGKEDGYSCPKKSTGFEDTPRPTCRLGMHMPDPSPNTYRWCDDVFGMQPAGHRYIRSIPAEKQPSLPKNRDSHVQSHDIGAMQVSFEKLLVEHSDPNYYNSPTNKTMDDRSISVLASDTPTRNGDYVMPYSRHTT